MQHVARDQHSYFDAQVRAEVKNYVRCIRLPQLVSMRTHWSEGNPDDHTAEIVQELSRLVARHRELADFGHWAYSAHRFFWLNVALRAETERLNRQNQEDYGEGDFEHIGSIVVRVRSGVLSPEKPA